MSSAPEEVGQRPGSNVLRSSDHWKRSSVIETQPMPASEKAIRRSGKRPGTVEKIQSTEVRMPLAGKRTAWAGGGVLTDGIMRSEPDPTWRFTAVSVSWQASNNGSQ